MYFNTTIPISMDRGQGMGYSQAYTINPQHSVPAFSSQKPVINCFGLALFIISVFSFDVFYKNQIVSFLIKIVLHLSFQGLLKFTMRNGFCLSLLTSTSFGICLRVVPFEKKDETVFLQNTEVAFYVSFLLYSVQKIYKLDQIRKDWIVEGNRTIDKRVFPYYFCLKIFALFENM